MSSPSALGPRPALSLGRRALPWLVSRCGALLSRLPPQRLATLMSWLSRGVRAARTEEAARARREVIAVSLACAGQGCLQRSVSTALLCRLRGCWPTWVVGVHKQGRFTAHAWVSVNGKPIEEPVPVGYLIPMIQVSREGHAPRPGRSTLCHTRKPRIRLYR